MRLIKPTAPMSFDKPYLRGFQCLPIRRLTLPTTLNLTEDVPWLGTWARSCVVPEFSQRCLLLKMWDLSQNCIFENVGHDPRTFICMRGSLIPIPFNFSKHRTLSQFLPEVRVGAPFEKCGIWSQNFYSNIWDLVPICTGSKGRCPKSMFFNPIIFCLLFCTGSRGRCPKVWF